MAGSSSPEPASAVRCALIVLDGLGDRPDDRTGGLSPVEAAFTPVLDGLVAQGWSDELSVLGPGIAPESDAGVFALLGYDPVRDSPGRGVLEAIGVGVPLAAGDVALRLNFATVAADGRVLDSRVGRSLTTEEAAELARDLTAADLLAPEGIGAEVRATVGHRGVLWLRPRSGGALSANISNPDPFYEKVGGMGTARQPVEARLRACRPTDGTPAAARTAAAVNSFLDRARALLAPHPVNRRRARVGAREATGLLVRNAGTVPEVPPEPFDRRYGVRGAAVTEMPVERGIARLLGLEDRFVGPMTGDRDAGYRQRACVTLELLARFGFVYVHLKGPDEPGHDGDAGRKLEVVEAIDRSFFGPFVAGLDRSTTRVAVTADHATPCALGAHSDDPVPLVVVGPGVAPGGGGASSKFGVARRTSDPAALVRGQVLLPRLLAPSPALPS